jgi:hypothetical protein
MPTDAGDIRVGGEAKIFLAPLGTAFPAFDVEPAAPWVDLGYVTTDGITLTYGREVTEIYALQSIDPVRIIQTKAPKSISFSMMQHGRDQLILALGGGTFVDEATAGVVRYTPPPASYIDERAMLLELVDGTAKYRYEYKRCQNREPVENKLVREDAATFPVTMQILVPSDASAPFEMVTNDTAFDDGVVLLGANGRTNGNGETVERDENGEPVQRDEEPVASGRKRG